jgi:uncharacterized protein (TIGR02996 family)
MVDDDFVQRILAAPNDASVRLVYADWLEERGDPRATFLRVEVALAAAASGGRLHRELQAGLRETAASIDAGWLAAVSRVPIENCGVSFRFRCLLRWEQLRPTADETVRFCEACGQQVFFCSSLKLAQTHAAVGDCIAVDPRLVRKLDDLESDLWELDAAALGMPLPGEDEPIPKDDELH